MAADRIMIYECQCEIVSGRQEETSKPYYKTWCEIKHLYGEELYKAMEIGLKNTIVFQVRYCKKIQEMQQRLKEFYVEYKGVKYDVYALDLYQNEKQYVQLKASSTV